MVIIACFLFRFILTGKSTSISIPTIFLSYIYEILDPSSSILPNKSSVSVSTAQIPFPLFLGIPRPRQVSLVRDVRFRDLGAR